jgi:hypothetical protein
MAGPSGMDKPAELVEHLDDPFRVFSALSQGDHERAAELMVGMSDKDFDSLAPVARALASLVESEGRARYGIDDDVPRQTPPVPLHPDPVQRWRPPAVEPLPIDPESAEQWARANARAETRAR